MNLDQLLPGAAAITKVTVRVLLQDGLHFLCGRIAARVMSVDDCTADWISKLFMPFEGINGVPVSQ